jgi:hypothetical protein
MPFQKCQHFPFAPRKAQGFNDNHLYRAMQREARGRIMNAGGAFHGRRFFSQMSGEFIPPFEMANEQHRGGGLAESSLRITHGRNVHKAAYVRKAFSGRVDSAV